MDIFKYYNYLVSGINIAIYFVVSYKLIKFFIV